MIQDKRIRRRIKPWIPASAGITSCPPIKGETYDIRIRKKEKNKKNWIPAKNMPG
jgi:hypothetical protein